MRSARMQVNLRPPAQARSRHQGFNKPRERLMIPRDVMDRTLGFAWRRISYGQPTIEN